MLHYVNTKWGKRRVKLKAEIDLNLKPPEAARLIDIPVLQYFVAIDGEYSGRVGFKYNHNNIPHIRFLDDLYCTRLENFGSMNHNFQVRLLKPGESFNVRIL